MDERIITNHLLEEDKFEASIRPDSIDEYIGQAEVKENLKILHPLPRINEISADVDENPHAYYFEQAKNGLYARQALICDVLNYSLSDITNDKTIIK